MAHEKTIQHRKNKPLAELRRKARRRGGIWTVEELDLAHARAAVLKKFIEDMTEVDPGKILIGVDLVQLQDHVDTLKNLKVVRLLKWEYTTALVFVTDILNNVAISEEDMAE